MLFISDKVKVICEKLYSMKKARICDLNSFKYCMTDYKKDNTLPNPDTMAQFDKNIRLCGNDKHFWFYTKIQPQSKVSGKRLYFESQTNSNGQWSAANLQGLVYLNGEIVQGLDINHTELLLDFDTEYEMYIYYYIGSAETKFTFDAGLTLVDEKIEKLYYDLHVPYEGALCLENDSENQIAILKHLDIALGYLDLRVPFGKAFYDSIDDVEGYLYNNFYNGVCGRSDAVVNCIGHTHIDVAYLWTVRQTVEKAQRSFSTVINLMKQFPEYKFMSSQPQLYEFVKNLAPSVYEQIKQMIKDGRWEAEGAMWLEADCNLISGESLVRQIMFGKRFMMSEFGVDSKCVWLPDVFGYSAALPQIMKKCGIERFVTSKISWNEFNKMPYDSFMWEGIDGTEIFTYFITTQDLPAQGQDNNKTTYSGYIRPKQVLGTWKRYQQKEFNNETLLTFGFGDGGGGPTKDMLEQQRRLSYGLPGFPKTKIDFTGKFLDNVWANFEKNTKLLKQTPKWVGELYLELHRGTYTSIAKNKRNNRKSELTLQTAESLSVAVMLLLSGKYSQQTINNCWKTVLLNQFHDIIPGSAIFEVYKQTDIDYAEILTTGNEIIKNAIDAISENVNTKGGLLVYNPNGFVCSDTVNYNGKRVFVKNIPSYGYKVLKPQPIADTVIVTKVSLENNFYSIRLDEQKNIISLNDKENCREVVKQGERLNELQLFEDYPKCYDAWEITEYYKQKMWIIGDVSALEIVDEGARKGLKITRNYLNSTIIQTIYLYDDIRRIDFESHIDWKEEHLLLKAAFPFDIHANEATYDIQFGNIKRPTHQNTSWDRAKFEVCAHKWADISDDGYGVSLLNDCKYGHSTEGSTLKLSLLKCATYPNPKADKEIHEFKYSLVPHSGSFKKAGIVEAANLFNKPLIVKEISANNGVLPDAYSLISCDNENIIIDTVKKAEDSNDIIVRLYECFDRKTKATLKFGFSVDKVYACDMLENNISELLVQKNELSIDVSNFEIVTLKAVSAN